MGNYYNAGKNILDGINQEKLDQSIKEKALFAKIQREFSKEDYEKGTEWALEGRDLDEAGALGNNKSFLNGYARGLRLIYIKINEISENIKKR